MTLPIKLEKKFLQDPIDAELKVELPSDPSLALAIVEGKPLPDGTDSVDLLDLSISAEGGAEDIGFAGGTGKVSFKASGSVYAGMGLRVDPKAVIEKMRLADDLGGASILTPTQELANPVYGFLSWGYGLDAETSGNIGLGAAGSVTFGATGDTERRYAVVRCYDRSTPMKDVLTGTVQSWAMPSNVESVAALERDTFVLADISSSVGVTVGAKVGYDFNWVKEIEGGELAGDIGLRLKAAMEAKLGFNMAGRFALVASALGDNRVRLRLVKMKSRGVEFAVDVGVKADIDASDVLPESLDDLVKATVGVQAGQMLSKLRELTDPEKTDLGEIFSEQAEEWAGDLLEKVVPEEAIENRRDQLLGLLDRWDELPGDLSEHIWSALDEIAGNADEEAIAFLNDVLGTAKEVAGTDDDAVRAYLTEQMERTDFFTSRIGQLLMTVGGDDLLDSLVDLPALDEIRSRATSLVSFFEQDGEDGGEGVPVIGDDLVAGALTRLHEAVSEKLKVDLWRTKLAEAEFDDLDAWVKQKLSDFVDERISFERFEKVQKTFQDVFKKGDALYEKTRELLEREYAADISFSYQKTRTGEALIDATFDLSDNLAKAQYDQAVRGEFDELLVTDIPSVQLHKGSLSHRTVRKKFLSLSLPLVSSEERSLNDSFAEFQPVDAEGARQLQYALKTTDKVTTKTNASRLVLEGGLGFGSPKVVTHLTGTLKYSYSYRQAIENLAADRVQYHVGPYVEKLLPGAFAGDETMEDWIEEMDRAVEADLGRETPGEFGDTLLGLDVVVPSEVCEAWYKQPGEGHAIDYVQLSTRLQAKLKELVKFYFLADPTKYRGTQLPLRAVLVYAAIPPMVDAVNGRLRRPHWTQNTDWDFSARGGKVTVPSKRATVRALKSQLPDVRERLSRIPGWRSLRMYEDNQAENMFREVTEDGGRSGLSFLLGVERDIINKAHTARTKMEEFARTGSSKPSEAVKALDDFGSNLTRAFNDGMDVFKSEGEGRPLGTMLMVEGALALNRNPANASIVSSLDVSVLRDLDQDGDPTWAEIKKAYLEEKDPKKELVAMRQRVVDVSPV